ncbi:unnamed protein product [Candidula unifasciata]|uniref:Helicase ARIP4 n=1 Tax=Candidula unifasciata TaxID=100452 RepID=A0A8S3YNZ2_9EUPU|nr:unnamed protein product [Candidula unifasciata]
MEDVTELIASGMGSDLVPKAVPSLFEPLESFLEDKRGQPTELNIMESDILALASQVGDELETSGVDESSIAADLSFLEDVETKESGDKDDALAFLVSGGQMEVDAEALDILDENLISKVDNYSEDDEESDSDEEISDAESGSRSESDDTEKTDQDEDNKDDDIEDDGVYGQVSFYDDEAASGNLLNVQSSQKTESKNKVKRKKSKKRLKAEGEGDSKLSKKKQKRKRRKLDGDKDKNGDTVFKSGSGVMRRKNIRSILSGNSLDKEMLSAQNEEFERQKRLMELKKSLLLESAAMGSATESASPVVSALTTNLSAGISTTNEKDSQLKSLLQVAEEEAEKEAERKQADKEMIKIKKEIVPFSPPSDVITLSSDSENSEGLDDDESDDVVMVPSDESDSEEDEDDGPEDINNGGSHINDTLNLPDTDGRVQVNIGHPAEDPDIFLAPQIAQAIKPHQIGGVRFLYDNLIESVERLRTTPGFGCILAHSMGLGKTIQMISLIDVFLRCAGGKRVLCIVPINTLQNWLAEFNYWLPPAERLHPEDDMTQSRTFPLFVINDSMKTTSARAAVVEKWRSSGGALVIGYEMFRLLSSKKAAPSRAKNRSRKAKQEVIDIEEEDKNKSLMIDMHSALVDPGPDLVMCDEGHRIKNSGAAISMALKSIKTRRRVVLTGYPLQNNLMEYWCMVDFVRPNFLGTKTEFSNMFERPIMNGQCVDSTAMDKKLMRHRSYVLHNLLEGFVQRRGHTVLQVNLPPKVEHVLLVRLSPIQRRMYCEFMKSITESGLSSWATNNPLKAFAVGCKLSYRHTYMIVCVCYSVLTQIISVITGIHDCLVLLLSYLTGIHDCLVLLLSYLTDIHDCLVLLLSYLTGIHDCLAEPQMKGYVGGILENSGKFMLMNSLVEECLALGDKVLIFSQSLLTLNKMEEFMCKMKVPRTDINECWQRNKTYFRLDGSTSAQDREKMINHFNDPESKVWAFLLSTKAGCLGINLVAANRVIVVDASWNPCHDCQAICRVYRFGQVKKSYVYRFITDNTLEKRIYDRQISKQGMSDRIVDDMNPENKLTRRQVENLLDFEDEEFPMLDFSNAASKYGHDSVMLNVLKKHGQWLTKHPFTHESLLIDRKELRLSKREKRLAKEGYARDKRMKLTNIRPPAAAFFPPQMGGIPYRMPYNNRYNYAAFQRAPAVRPIASVRPMVVAHSQNREDKAKPFGSQPLRPGVSIHQVITTTDIVLPGTNTGTQAGANGNKIVAGEKIMVIKTPKGVYIRTDDGKMFAVKSKSGSTLEDITRSCISTTSTATTATLSSARGSRDFPGYGTSAASGGKRSQFTIAGNKKGLSFTGSESGHNSRTSAYENFTSLGSLKPQFLKTGTAELRSSPAFSPIPSLQFPLPASGSGKNTSLADLIASDDYIADRNKMISAAQMHARSKMPGTDLPSLATRTPRQLSHIQMSAAASSGGGGGGGGGGGMVGPANHRLRRSVAAEHNSALGMDKKNEVQRFSAKNTLAQNNKHGAAAGAAYSVPMTSNKKQTLSHIETQASHNFNRNLSHNSLRDTQQQISQNYSDVAGTYKSNTETGSSHKFLTSSPPSSEGDTNSLGRDLQADTLTVGRDLVQDSLGMSSQRPHSAGFGQRYRSGEASADLSKNVTEEGSKALQNTGQKFNMANTQRFSPYPSDLFNPYLDSTQGKRPVQKHLSTYLDVNDFLPFSSIPFSQSVPASLNHLEDDMHEASSVYDSSSSNSYQFGSSFTPSIQPNATFPSTNSSNNPSFSYSSNFVDRGSVNSPSFVPQDHGQQDSLPSKIKTTFNLPNSNTLYSMDMPFDDVSSQGQQQKFSTSSSSSTTPTPQEHGLVTMDSSAASPASSPRHASNISDSINHFLAIASSQKNSADNRTSNSTSQGFRSSSYDMQESGPTNDDSNGSNSLGGSSFSMIQTGRFSPAHSRGTDKIRGGISSVTTSSQPQSFRSKREHESSAPYYNSKMSLFNSQSMQRSAGDDYGSSSAYDSNYGTSAQPFSSSTLMSPSEQPRYSQASLSYPRLSPLMSGTSSSPSPALPSDGGSIWPSLSAGVIDRDYNYPPHSSNVGFSTGHNQTLGQFTDSEANL